MEKMTTMNTEGQKQISEHRQRMAEVEEYMKKGKMPPGVGPLNKFTGQQQKDLPPIPQSFPEDRYEKQK